MLLGLGCACLLAFGLAAAPRLFLVLGWLFGTRWNFVFDGWLWPLLGIIFLPYTTVMYLLSYDILEGGIFGWAWLWIILGVLLDLMQWGSIYERRQEIPYASQYTGGAA